jgi:hypothetical protein
MPSHTISNNAATATTSSLHDNSSSRDDASDWKNHDTKNALGKPQINNGTIAYCVFALETAATSPVLHSKPCGNAPQGPFVFRKIL